MIKPNKLSIIIFLLTLVSCQETKQYTKVNINAINDSLNKKSEINFKNWHQKDIEIDTIPGISLERAYDSLLIDKKDKEVVVAVIDMIVELNHKGLQNYIWKNINEIPNNNIDDDDNGYIDDINGWNFLGNGRGENNQFVNYEYTRILRKYNSQFKKKEKIHAKDSLDFKVYKNAQQMHSYKEAYAKEELDYINMVDSAKSESEELLSKYFVNNNYSIRSLDSLKKIYQKDTVLQNMIIRKTNFIKYNYTDEFVNLYMLKAGERINKLLNLNYNDRKIQGDDPNDITDINYGTGSFKGNTKLLDHGTKMAGIIANIGLNKEIKIMPLTVCAYGDEEDKDIALAIRYAVDNGAKVINMSFYKFFSLNKKMVDDAFKYAAAHDVLIVNCAGNEAENLDKEANYSFPNDRDYFNTTPEISDNFLKVGGSFATLNETFRWKSSNYGKEDVDLFAPGRKIYTTAPNNEYTYSGGTSSASAITSGVAALLFSYYPTLTASEVKHILMDSGLEYTIPVSTPTKEDKEKTTPFNELSKSGKVLNAYNALIMADSIARQ